MICVAFILCLGSGFCCFDLLCLRFLLVWFDFEFVGLGLDLCPSFDGLVGFSVLLLSCLPRVWVCVV